MQTEAHFARQGLQIRGGHSISVQTYSTFYIVCRLQKKTEVIPGHRNVGSLRHCLSTHGDQPYLMGEWPNRLEFAGALGQNL